MPNEQTSVPLFASGEVLTAANMNISAGTGVPVFTNTTTRDAGFGGAGEKVLAEGQLCYLSSTNVVQYYDGAAWATVGPSSAITGATAQTNSTQSTTSTTYVDLATVTSVTVTTGTSAFCVWHAACANGSANVGVYVSVAVSGASTVAATDNITNLIQTPSSNIGVYIPMSSGHIFTGLTAGSNTFTMKYRTSSGTATFDTRGIQVITL
jgi:hypothetical protein